MSPVSQQSSKDCSSDDLQVTASIVTFAVLLQQDLVTQGNASGASDFAAPQGSSASTQFDFTPDLLLQHPCLTGAGAAFLVQQPLAHCFTEDSTAPGFLEQQDLLLSIWTVGFPFFLAQQDFVAQSFPAAGRF